MWECINSFISNKNSIPSDVIVIEVTNYIDPAIIAKKFNKNFVNSIDELSIPYENEHHANNNEEATGQFYI